VRNLAQRSADAAKQIKSLITDSVGQVDKGARLADDAGKTMGEVVASVNRVSAIIGEIAAATQEQSSGITQVNTAVGELDKVTQQNAALVEESTAASEQLKGLAREMADAVSVFRLADSAPALSIRSAPAGAALAAPRPTEEMVIKSLAMRARAKALASNAPMTEEWKQF
jgi:uncharacterized phage infection (PIP) family protein YhgE